MSLITISHDSVCTANKTLCVSGSVKKQRVMECYNNHLLKSTILKYLVRFFTKLCYFLLLDTGTLNQMKKNA